MTSTTKLLDNGNQNNESSEEESKVLDINDQPRYRSNLKAGQDASARSASTGTSTSTSTSTSRLKKKMKTSTEKTSRYANDDTYKDQKAPNQEEQVSSPIKKSLMSTNEDYSIDSFLRGEYDRPFADDAAAPHPELSPGETIESALHALGNLDDPEVSHGAAVFLRFCAPLSRSDRWGGSVLAPWKEILRGSLTPTMLARRIRASEEFSVLLDWENIDVTEGMAVPESNKVMGSTVAFVNAALFFRTGIEPSIVQFTLRKISGVWLIDLAVISKREWFISAGDGEAVK